MGSYFVKKTGKVVNYFRSKLLSTNSETIVSKPLCSTAWDTGLESSQNLISRKFSLSPLFSSSQEDPLGKLFFIWLDAESFPRGYCWKDYRRWLRQLPKGWLKSRPKNLDWKGPGRKQTENRELTAYSAVPRNLEGHTFQGTKKVQGSGRVWLDHWVLNSDWPWGSLQAGSEA